ncbi:MAG: DUF2500 domain-containing protein [Herpetosiphonaceae bacterium]|nr:DUF2500 domain-containing protein [Herpetosiphonaceae bacterium]
MTLVLILIMVLLFILPVGFIIFLIVRGLVQRSENNRMPVLSVGARIVAKRTQTGGGKYVSTSYYVTFEAPTGERREFVVSGSEYGILGEHDTGMLTYQGTRYKGFQRAGFPPGGFQNRLP